MPFDYFFTIISKEASQNYLTPILSITNFQNCIVGHFSPSPMQALPCLVQCVDIGCLFPLKGNIHLKKKEKKRVLGCAAQTPLLSGERSSATSACKINHHNSAQTMQPLTWQFLPERHLNLHPTHKNYRKKKEKKKTIYTTPPMFMQVPECHFYCRFLQHSH